MKILINYANDAYKKAQDINTWTGKHIAKFDKIYSFGPDDIEESFKQEHSDIFSFKRGNGLWLWKSYLISKVMDECSDGDYVFYIDSGAFFVRNADTIIESMRDNEKIWVSDCPLLESCFTKPECFELMDCNEDFYKTTNQIQGTFFAAVCCDESRAFVKEWLSYCCNIEIIKPEGGLNLTENVKDGFVAHREDQSVLSLLSKKHGIKAHKDPSQRGVYPETFYSPNYTYRVPEHSDDKYKPFVFLHKSGNFNLFKIFKMIVKTFLQVKRTGKILK